MSLRAYLARLAETLLTPSERAERAEKARAALKEWNGYAPTSAEERDLDGELDRRLAQGDRPVSDAIVLDLDLAAALAVARAKTWAAAHSQYAALPTPDRPDGGIIATTAPHRWAGEPVRVLDLTP